MRTSSRTRRLRGALAMLCASALAATTLVVAPGGVASANGIEDVPLPTDDVVRIAGYPWAPDPGFTDVPEKASFAQAAAWLRNEDITQGQGGQSTFAPGATVNRRQMALFIWRMMGRPEAPEDCTFDDVVIDPQKPADVEFIEAVCWLKSADVTKGVNQAGTLFAPGEPVKRGQMALFLYRLVGKPTGSPAAGFTDVPTSGEVADAVKWLKAFSITSGVSPTSFAPGQFVTRGQMAAFLFRLASNGDAWNPGYRARGSVRQISVEGTPGTVVSVYDDQDQLVDTEELDIDGGRLWRSVDAGTYQVAVEGPNGPVVTRIEVLDGTLPLDPDFAHPSGPVHTGQSITQGFGYITTRDGTQLSVMVTFPGGPGPYPTVVEYSGYDLSNPFSVTSGSSPYRLLAPQFGYAIVQVQMRGGGCSAGAFDYFEELQSLDGYDAIETIASQSWVKGNKVGMVGISYPGISQLFVAQTRPPSLAAITPVSVIHDTVRGVLFPGGMFNNGFAKNWAEGAVQRGEPARRQPDGSWTGGQGWVGQKIVGSGSFPPDKVCERNQRLHGQAADLLGRIETSQYETAADEYLGPMRFVDRIEAPTLMVGAWQDEQTGGMWPNMLDRFDDDTFVRMIVQNGTHIEPIATENFKAAFEHLAMFVKEERPNFNVALVNTLIGAAAGTLLGTTPTGEGALVFTASQYDRTDRYPTFAAAKAAYLAAPRAFVRLDNGAGPNGGAGGSLVPAETRFFERWPLSSSEATTEQWYLRGNGSLTSTAPTEADGDIGSSVSYAYDPSTGLDTTWTKGPGCSEWLPNPTDTTGASCFNWEQPANANMVAFESPALTSPKLMVGNALASLWLTVDAPFALETDDTDLEVTISEVRSDGKEVYVQSGWARTSYCVPDPEYSTPLAPWPTATEADAATCALQRGVAKQVEVPIKPFGHIFRAGSKIRVSVDAPGGSRVLWTFDSRSGDKTHTIGTSSTKASRVTLPVVTAELRNTAADNRPPVWQQQAVRAPKLSSPPTCGVLRAQPCRTYVPWVLEN